MVRLFLLYRWGNRGRSSWSDLRGLVGCFLVEFFRNLFILDEENIVWFKNLYFELCLFIYLKIFSKC